ncbi:MAG: DUF2157 domain-containing protein [Bacteroidia bacterium]|nr:DUF2157 domain-containing protein [Bacteroidia bacterium]
MNLADLLHKNGILSEQETASINSFEKNKTISVHWELRTILYLGILLFISGISVLVYQNIDTIGHQAILAFILLACGGGFYYSIKMRKPYTHTEVKHESPFPDYAILSACLLLGVFVTYLQAIYNVFGYNYGLATFIPAMVYLSCAYLFDHKGVLSLGITGVSAWAGLSVTPMELLKHNDFSSLSIIITGIIIGAVFAAAGYISVKKEIKSHFAFSYNNFALNILFVATLSALFTLSLKPISFILLAGITYYYIVYAIKHKSFLFLLLSVVYGYIGLTYSLFNMFSFINSEFGAMLAMMYVIVSCVGVVLFFVFYKRILKIS